MSEPKPKPAKNRGDSWMAAGVLMIVLSIILPALGIDLGSAVNQGLLYGGLIVAVLGLGIRSSLRRKARKSS